MPHPLYASFLDNILWFGNWNFVITPHTLSFLELYSL